MKCYWGFACLLLLCRTLTLEAQQPSDSLQMVQWYQQGVTLKRAQKYDSARVYFERTHRIALAQQYWLHYFKVEKQYARFLRDLDYLPIEAISKLDSLIPLAESRLGSKSVETGELYEVRANTYNAAGQYALAFQDYLQSLSIRREVFGNTHQRVAASYLNLGPLFLNHQQPEKAIRYAQLGIDILKQEKRYPVFFLSNAYTWQGRAYDQLGQYLEAEKSYEQAYQILVANHLLERSATFSLYLHQVGLYIHQNQYKKAQKQLALAKTFAERHFSPQDPKNARVDMLASELELAKKDYKRAEAAALRARNHYQQANGNNINRLASTYNMLGQITLAQKQWQKAHQYFQQSISHIYPAYDSQKGAPQPSPQTIIQSPGRLITVLYNQALTYHREGLASGDTLLWIQASEALNTSMAWIAYSRSALQEPEDRSRLTNFRFRVYELAMANAYQLSQASNNPHWQALSLEIAERSRANLLWESLQKDQILNPTALPQSIIKEQNRIESSIHLARNDWFSLWQRDKQHPDLTILQNEVVRLQLSQDSLQYVISRQYPDYHTLKYQQEVPSLDRIQKNLAGDHQLLEYFYTDTVLYLLQIQSTDFHIHRIRLEEDFSNTLSLWQQQLQNPALSSPQSLAEQGYHIFQKLLPFDLDSDSIQSLLIIPDGPLTQLPFELLVREAASPNDYRDIPYLFEQSNIRYAYAAWTLLANKKPQDTDQYWAGFAPSYQVSSTGKLYSSRDAKKQLSSLSGAEAEVRRISQQMPGEYFMGAAASKANFLQQAEAFKVLHLALHAYILEDRPMYSGLIFGEAAKQDTLLLHEIYPLKLQSELTVLSACNTGLGQRQKGEGNLSLAHAFAYAGCPSVVMSLWPVDDQSTQDLMEAFYQALKAGNSKSQSLRIARQKYLAEHDLSHPYYWGAFVSIGDDSPLSSPRSVSNFMIKLLLYLLLAYLLYWIGKNIRKKFNRSVD
ncbi:MAG: CHAT domain-containing protein [Bacteroidota bacterium]